MSNKHGDFIWYELLTSDADRAQRFYSDVLGWQVEDSGQPGMDYRILMAPDAQTGAAIAVGGLMQITDEMASGGARPVWLGYIAVDDVDASLAKAVAAGSTELMPATDIPNVGRIAFFTDPQGVPIYIMRGLSDEPSLAFAFDKPRVGHCAWNELSTPDPAAALQFYSAQFGWAKDGEMDMGEMGAYEFLRHGGVFGAMMPKPADMPVALWSYYFRVANIDEAVDTVAAAGGQVVFGPSEIPGGEFIIHGIDPTGAMFALVGVGNPREPA
ncbi:VOC family protein [Pseudomonas borbori]